MREMCMFACVHVFVCMFVCMCVCVIVYLCACVYVPYVCECVLACDIQ